MLNAEKWLMRERMIPLNQETVVDIKDVGERIFAEAVLLKPQLEVFYQIPLNGKVIDFQVRNTRQNGHGRKKLVEVTKSRRPSCDIGLTQSKREQKRVMKRSGQPFTILFGNDLSRINTNNDLGHSFHLKPLRGFKERSL